MITWVPGYGFIPMTLPMLAAGFPQKFEQENGDAEKFYVFHGESRLLKVT